MSKPVQDGIQIVETAKKEFNAKFKGTELVNTLLEFNSLFDRMLTRLKYMGGTLSEANEKTTKPDFPPITNFMGEEIVISKKIERGELNPKEDERQRTKAKVQKLYDTIRGLTPEQVLNAYTIPEDIIIVRGVAKWAGVDDYETKELNVAFIEEIQVAIEVKEEEKETQSTIDDATKQSNSKVLTKEDIDADADLQKWKAQPGDTLVTRADGKRKLKPQKP